MKIRKAHGIWALMATLALGGCSTQFYDERTQGYAPEMPDQVYPIDVVKGAVKLSLPARSARLTPEEENAVRRLGGQAVSHSAPVIVRRPAGSLNAEVVAAKATRLLAEAGVDPDRIRHVSYRGKGPVSISYKRKFAVTRECGDWSSPINETSANKAHANFGCAQQNNIAAQVANPEDFERPRLMTPPDPDQRVNALVKYGQKEDVTTQASDKDKAKVSDAKN